MLILIVPDSISQKQFLAFCSDNPNELKKHNGSSLSCVDHIVKVQKWLMWCSNHNCYNVAVMIMHSTILLVNSVWLVSELNRPSSSDMCATSRPAGHMRCHITGHHHMAKAWIINEQMIWANIFVHHQFTHRPDPRPGRGIQWDN